MSSLGDFPLLDFDEWLELTFLPLSLAVVIHSALIARFCNHPMGRQSLPHSVVSRWKHCPKLPVHAARLSSSVRNTTFLARHILLPLLPRNLLVSDETMTTWKFVHCCVSNTCELQLAHDGKAIIVASTTRTFVVVFVKWVVFWNTSQQ